MKFIPIRTESIKLSLVINISCVICLLPQDRSCSKYQIWAATWQYQQSDCAPSENSDQPGHPPSLIRVFAVRMKKAWVLSYPLGAQRRLWSDWADAQADLSLRWAHSHFVGFVMSRHICTGVAPLEPRHKKTWLRIPNLCILQPVI